MTNDINTELPTPIAVVHRKIPILAGVNQYQSPFTQVIYVKSGVLSIITDSGRHFVPPTQAIAIPAQLSHELLAKTEVELTLLSFESKPAEILPDEIKVLSISTFLKHLLDECQSIDKHYLWHETPGRLLRLIRDYLACAPSLDIFLPYPKDPRLTNITEKLLKHPSLKSDLISWGKFVNASSRTLTRIFKKETGITYSEWRQRLNIQIAIKHLAVGDSISHIAKLLGYESSSAFIYMFKKQMGISPNQFLKS
ncbi:AraC family transcriptional regulator [Thalassotalea insulae]|uniref:AraC family transcriptional regulator n=1 Tax=Thalassotalea insulae TaxID=2056778 RepID=A0ABQ6GT74_9GAMM|nr:AraC family transcriptional regulator [Thalassotalea insulae]GLX78547.1 AraC family transcriptional regulator [Thalassotalea insulae]